MLAARCCCFPSSLTKWVRPGVAVGDPRALTGQTPWRWMAAWVPLGTALIPSTREPSTMCIIAHRCCAGDQWCRCKACCATPIRLRIGWSAKTLRRISASIKLIILLEPSHAINPLLPTGLYKGPNHCRCCSFLIQRISSCLAPI